MVFDELLILVIILSIWNILVVENVIMVILVVYNSGDLKSFVMKDVFIFVVILVFCCVNVFVVYGICRSRKLKREVDEEEGGILRC